MFCFERDSFKKYGRVFFRKEKRDSSKKKRYLFTKMFSFMEENRKRRKKDDVSEMKTMFLSDCFFIQNTPFGDLVNL